jgi:hypothetical protein
VPKKPLAKAPQIIIKNFKGMISLCFLGPRKEFDRIISPTILHQKGIVIRIYFRAFFADKVILLFSAEEKLYHIKES